MTKAQFVTVQSIVISLFNSCIPASQTLITLESQIFSQNMVVMDSLHNLKKMDI